MVRELNKHSVIMCVYLQAAAVSSHFIVKQRIIVTDMMQYIWFNILRVTLCSYLDYIITIPQQ
jgi:hypothetical protein